MELHICTVHPMHMKKSARKARRPTYRRTFLQEWRDHVGMTQEQAGEAIGMSHSQLSRIERGQSPYSQPLLEAAAKLYGCTENDLISRGPDQAKSVQSVLNELDADQQDQAVRLLLALRRSGK